MRDRDKPKAQLIDEVVELRGKLAELQGPAAERRWTEDMIRSLFTESPLAICLIQHDRLVFANPMFETLTGYAEDKLVGEDPLRLVEAEGGDLVRKELLSGSNPKQSHPYELRLGSRIGEGFRTVLCVFHSVTYRGAGATMMYCLDSNGPPLRSQGPG